MLSTEFNVRVTRNLSYWFINAYGNKVIVKILS